MSSFRTSVLPGWRYSSARRSHVLQDKKILVTTQSQLVRLHSVLSSAKPAVFGPIVIDLGGIEPPAGSCEPAGTSHDLIVAGFWIAKLQRKLSRLPSSKPLSAFRNVTYHESLGTRVERVHSGYEELDDHCIILYRKYNSDRDVLEHTNTSLITTTLVAHPGGENHELAISPNY